MTELFKNLCNAKGISGREDEVRKLILSEIEPHAQCRVDALGNIIAFKKGKSEASSKVMLAAHMDEVGFMVNYITESGFIKITPVGGIDRRVVYGRRVLIGENDVVGVIGAKAVHLLKSDEREKVPDFSEMYVDIGAESRGEAEKYVKIGDSVYFDSDVYSFGDGFIKGKAIDDRAGCALLIDMIKGEQPYDLYFVFTVQEEVGTRGAKGAAFSLMPDKAIVVETTTAADIGGVDGEKRVCELGKGPVVSFMDRGTVYDRELYDLAFRIAEREKIPCQTKTLVAGGNDSSAIHVSAGGVRTAAVSLPCRYLHSPSCVIREKDYDDAARLIPILAGEMASC